MQPRSGARLQRTAQAVGIVRGECSVPEGRKKHRTALRMKLGFKRPVLSPLRGSIVSHSSPTACAVGCNLAPLRGYVVRRITACLPRFASSLYNLSVGCNHNHGTFTYC